MRTTAEHFLHAATGACRMRNAIEVERLVVRNLQKNLIRLSGEQGR